MTDGRRRGWRRRYAECPLNEARRSQRYTAADSSFVWREACRGAVARIAQHVIPIAPNRDTRRRSLRASAPVAPPSCGGALAPVPSLHSLCSLHRPSATTPSANGPLALRGAKVPCPRRSIVGRTPPRHRSHTPSRCGTEELVAHPATLAAPRPSRVRHGCRSDLGSGLEHGTDNGAAP